MQNDRVQHELTVRSRDDKTTRNGDPYSVVSFGNTTGQLSANVWKEQLPWLEGVRAGSVVQVIGLVELYQGKRQLKLSAPPRIVATAAVDLEEFLPKISGDVTQLWDTIDQWRGSIRSQTLRRAADVFFADDAFRAAFEKCPGAPRGHHAKIGGLIQHVVEVATIARAATEMMRGDVDLVTVGALIHDVGKVDSYTIGAAGFDYTPAGRLLGHVALGALMLERRLRLLPQGTFTEAHELELQHFILSHHGLREFGAAVEPMTLEADLLHWADQASANGNDFNEAAQDPELFPSDEEFSVRKSWRLDRRVWRRPAAWA
ncbi:MAG: HD domain-containing protein [Gemmatimonadetes bacterium]|nr:HD domain-containing protein [Gemmatimonadota bacterium]